MTEIFLSTKEKWFAREKKRRHYKWNMPVEKLNVDEGEYLCEYFAD